MSVLQGSESGANLIDALRDHRQEMLGYVHGRVGNRDDAEDILQDASLKAFQNSDKLRDIARFKPWFYRIIATTIADWGRRKTRKEDSLENPDLLPAAATESKEDPICRCGVHLLAEIKPNYAEVLRRVLLGGETVDAVADSLGVTRGNLWVRLHRAREALRRKLDNHCAFAPNSLVCRCACGFTSCCCSATA